MSLRTSDDLVHGVAAPRVKGQGGVFWCGDRYACYGGRVVAAGSSNLRVTCLGCIAREAKYQSVELGGKRIVDWTTKELQQRRKSRAERIKRMVGSLYPMLLQSEIQTINDELMRRRCRAR